MFVSVHLRAAWVVVVLAAGWMACCGRAVAERPSDESGGGFSVDEQEQPAVDQRKRKKMVDTFMRQLGRLKPVGAAKKDLDDFYLLATAELNMATRHADVCFQVKQGQREVAEFLVDYIVNKPEHSMRKWHVFSRFKDSQQADQALQFTRMQYDQMTAYQAQIRKIYNAKTTRRT